MKILYVTTIGGTMRFFKHLIKGLVEEGSTVDIAANTSISNVPAEYLELGCKVLPISCTRSPFNKGTLTAIKELQRIVSVGNYDIVHCHTPVAGVCARIACRKVRRQRTRVFYTAHGFHFYRGASLKNWLLYYPVEKLCARLTDVLITINQEDYALAQKRMKAGRVEYVPGVGIDVAKFAKAVVERDTKREEIGVPKDALFLLSVGELSPRKNHEVIIRALAETNNKCVHYGIAGKGPLYSSLLALSEELGVRGQVHLLGHRTDISELYKCADICVLPSAREGFGLAAIEGMAAGLPLIVSDTSGARSYAINNVNAIVCPVGNYPEQYSAAIDRLANDSFEREAMGRINGELVKQFDVEKINQQMRDIYGM